MHLFTSVKTVSFTQVCTYHPATSTCMRSVSNSDLKNERDYGV